MVDFTKMLEEIANKQQNQNAQQPKARKVDPEDSSVPQPPPPPPISEDEENHQKETEVSPSSPEQPYPLPSQPVPSKNRGCKYIFLSIFFFFLTLFIINFIQSGLPQIFRIFWNTFSEKEDDSDVHVDVEDDVFSFNELVKEASRGDSQAQYNLAYCYENGQGVTENQEKAFFWYTKSAEQENSIAQYKVAQRYENGIGVAKDIPSAVYWYTKAMDSGVEGAKEKLDELDPDGRYAEQIEESRTEFFREAKQGNAQAQLNLGLCYAAGDGVDQNEEKAFYWIKQAAEQDVGQAQYLLGVCYKTGTGTKENRDLAISWLKKAIDNDVEDAQDELDDLTE